MTFFVQSSIKCVWQSSTNIEATGNISSVLAVQPKFGGYLQHFTAQDVAYFQDMPFSLSIPSHGVLVVHAGIVPERPLEQQLLSNLLNVCAALC